MEKILGNILVLNGQLADVSAFNPGLSTGLYYEVIRLMEGKLLFLNDHLERLNSSSRKAGILYPESDDINAQIRLLISHLSIENGNIKVLVYQESGKINFCCFQIPHSYPGKDDYEQGVNTMSVKFVRPDPTIKKWNEIFRTEISQLIQVEHIYEAVLLNETGRLTEGSRSNLFFIDQKNEIVTAPENLILAGITRKYVLDLCRQNKIKIIEKAISLKEAATMQSCFITGTSPMVLPVKLLDKIEFDVSHQLLADLISGYAMILKNHLNN